jgi:hypothetical protein
VDTLPVVAAFDVGEHVASGFVLLGPLSLLDEFDLEGVEEASHRRIAQTVATAADGLPHAGRAEQLAVIVGSALRAAVRMLQQSRWRPLPLDGHGEAAQVRSARMCWRMDQPTTLRVARSSTAAR